MMPNNENMEDTMNAVTFLQKGIIPILTLVSLVFGIAMLATADPIEEFSIQGRHDIDVRDMYHSLIADENAQPDDPLALTRNDVIFIVNENEAGESFIDLYVRKKPYINSILLVNPKDRTMENQGGSVYADPYSGNEVDYGLRALKYNDVNGDELRYYNGRFFNREDQMWFLIDSTPEQHSLFGDCFHIRIPNYVQYGYDSQNFGLMRITPDRQDIVINIRTYFRKYADYRGRFLDNYFEIRPNEYQSGDALRFQLWENSLSQVLIGEEEYFVVRAIFTGHTKFFNYFTIQEILRSPRRLPETEVFRDIGYVTDRSQIRTDSCILLESLYVNGRKFVMADIYLKKLPTEREIEINMRDHNDITAVRSLHYIIPPIGQSVPPVEPNNPRWGTEEDLGRMPLRTSPSAGEHSSTPYYPERYGRDYIEEGEDPREDPPIY
jgi:hypothetical protein